jgi:hypothetical protein
MTERDVRDTFGGPRVENVAGKFRVADRGNAESRDKTYVAPGPRKVVATEVRVSVSCGQVSQVQCKLVTIVLTKAVSWLSLIWRVLRAEGLFLHRKFRHLED